MKMESRARSPLNETFWQMHRNSLIFSALLFILSVPGVTPMADQEQWGFSLGNNGARALVFVIGVSATYAILVLLFEWREQALPELRREQGRAEDTMLSIHAFSEHLARGLADGPDVIGRISSQIDQIARRVLIMDYDSSTTLKTAWDKYDPEFVDSEAAAREFLSSCLEISLSESLHDKTNKQIIELITSPAGAHFHSYGRTVIDKSISRIYEDASAVTRGIVDNLVRNIISADNIYRRTHECLELQRKAQKLLSRSVIHSSLATHFGLVFIAIAAPCAAYLVSVFHALGKVGTVHVYSPLFHLLGITPHGGG